MFALETKLKHILIVEDDNEMQEMYKMIFSEYKNKYKVEFETKANAALERIKKKDYDLIILDIIMEPMPGDSFFVYARGMAKTAEVPILIVSVLNPHTLRTLKEINHVEFLQKPITPTGLIEKIKQMI